jgi:hypothetical protein
VVLVTIDTVNQQEGDIRTCGRIIKGISGLQQSGYTVTQYEAMSEDRSKLQRRIIAVERTDGANDAEFLAWLNSLCGKGDGDN